MRFPRKIKSIDRDEWKRIKEKEVLIKEVVIGNTKHFNKVECYVSLIKIKRVESRLEKKMSEDTTVVVVDNNWTILEIFPKHKNFCISVHFDDKCNVIQWYFDIVDYVKKSKSGKIYMSDLYLDLIGLPNHKYFIDDQDELEFAKDQRKITFKQYLIARKTLTKEVIPLFKYNFEGLLEITNEALELFN